MPEFPQMTVLNLVLGGTIFTKGGHSSPVNNVLGRQYSLVNNIREDISGGTLYTMTAVLHVLWSGSLVHIRLLANQIADSKVLKHVLYSPDPLN